jgi:hypothetical protein
MLRLSGGIPSIPDAGVFLFPGIFRSGKKRRAARLPLSGPPIAFFVTPNLPLCGRKYELLQRVRRSYLKNVHFSSEKIPWIIASLLFIG